MRYGLRLSYVLGGVFAMTLSACADPNGDASGAQLWLDYCSACHGTLAEGNAQGPELAGEADEVADVVEVILNGEGLMNPVEGLTRAQATDIADFLVNDLLAE